MAETQFNQYTNLIIFAKEWRKYKLELKPLDETAFRTEMQSNEYVKLECSDIKRKKTVLIYLFDKNSKYMISSQDLRRLIKKIKNPCQVILVTYKPLTTYGKKVIRAFKHIDIITYRHEIFDLIIPNGPLCYPHRIMTREEVLDICNNDLCCYLTNLPKIFDEDPQCIWIGAVVGDVLEIKMLSDITGEALQYRVVVPKSGRIIAIKESKEDTTEDNLEDSSKLKEVEDDEVLEHIEHAHSEDTDGQEEEIEEELDDE
jgi:DNA-directed RNA polymerase subunit H (RpoH/RPB5)